MIAILANGAVPQHPIPCQILADAALLVCCDGALAAARAIGREPDFVVGDGDRHVRESFQLAAGAPGQRNGAEAEDAGRFHGVNDILRVAGGADGQQYVALAPDAEHLLGENEVGGLIVGKGGAEPHLIDKGKGGQRALQVPVQVIDVGFNTMSDILGRKACVRKVCSSVNSSPSLYCAK